MARDTAESEESYTSVADDLNPSYPSKMVAGLIGGVAAIAVGAGVYQKYTHSTEYIEKEMIEYTLDHPESLKDLISDPKWSENHHILPIIKSIVDELSSEKGHDP